MTGSCDLCIGGVVACRAELICFVTSLGAGGSLGFNSSQGVTGSCNLFGVGITASAGVGHYACFGAGGGSSLCGSVAVTKCCNLVSNVGVTASAGVSGITCSCASGGSYYCVVAVASCGNSGRYTAQFVLADCAVDYGVVASICSAGGIYFVLFYCCIGNMIAECAIYSCAGFLIRNFQITTRSLIGGGAGSLAIARSSGGYFGIHNLRGHAVVFRTICTLSASNGYGISSSICAEINLGVCIAVAGGVNILIILMLCVVFAGAGILTLFSAGGYGGIYPIAVLVGIGICGEGLCLNSSLVCGTFINEVHAATFNGAAIVGIIAACTAGRINSCYCLKNMIAELASYRLSTLLVLHALIIYISFVAYGAIGLAVALIFDYFFGFDRIRCICVAFGIIFAHSANNGEGIMSSIITEGNNGGSIAVASCRNYQISNIDNGLRSRITEIQIAIRTTIVCFTTLTLASGLNLFYGHQILVVAKKYSANIAEDVVVIIFALRKNFSANITIMICRRYIGTLAAGILSANIADMISRVAVNTFSAFVPNAIFVGISIG